MKLCETCRNKKCKQQILTIEEDKLKTIQCLEYEKDISKIERYKKELKRTASQLKPLMNLNI